MAVKTITLEAWNKLPVPGKGRAPSQWDETLDALEDTKIVQVDIPANMGTKGARIGLARTAAFRNLGKLEFREEDGKLYARLKVEKTKGEK